MKTKKKKLVIGRSDKADLPAFNIENIKIKIDSGSYNSSIHCGEIEEVIIESEKYIKFKLLDSKHPKYFFDELFSKVHDYKKIKSSNGSSEFRYIIESEIKLFDKIYTTTFSLTDRSTMKFPILIGRKLLANHFIVDVSKKNLSQKKKEKKASKNLIKN